MGCTLKKGSITPLLIFMCVSHFSDLNIKGCRDEKMEGGSERLITFTNDNFRYDARQSKIRQIPTQKRLNTHLSPSSHNTK
jgi:hypothetical protein